MRDLLLIEHWSSTLVWEQHGGIVVPDDGEMDPGDPTHVSAECRRCKHAWRLRCNQVTDLHISQSQE